MTYEALPNQFVASLKVLFGVLDTNNHGKIRFTDLESNWNRESTKDLPVDVVECLKSVSSPDGYLTFDQFVRGLKLSLNKRDPVKAYDPPPKPLKPAALQARAFNLPYQALKHPGAEANLSLRTALEDKHKRTSEYVKSQSISNLASDPMPPPDQYRRAVPKRKDSTRRHTLGHGVDGNMVRRSKVLEEERDVLLDGLKSLDKARDWYTRRLGEVNQKMRFLDPSEMTIDRQQERLNFEKLRIQELNQQLAALTEPSGRGGLMHMNLARPMDSRPSQEHAMQLLRGHNRMLTKEVSQKSDRISHLEKEKAALLKDLFEFRSQHHTRSYEESTFM